MTDHQSGRLQFFSCQEKAISRCRRTRFGAQGTKSARLLGNRRSLWQNCNRNALLPVIASGVDALSTTWMILMQARWLTLRFSMMMRRLADWFSGCTRSWSKWSARTVRAERQRRIFAK